MELVGTVALGIIGVGVLAGAVVAVLSLPDLRRYRRLRRM